MMIDNAFETVWESILTKAKKVYGSCQFRYKLNCVVIAFIPLEIDTFIAKRVYFKLVSILKQV